MYRSVAHGKPDCMIIILSLKTIYFKVFIKVTTFDLFSSCFICSLQHVYCLETNTAETFTMYFYLYSAGQKFHSLHFTNSL